MHKKGLTALALALFAPLFPALVQERVKKKRAESFSESSGSGRSLLAFHIEGVRSRRFLTGAPREWLL